MDGYRFELASSCDAASIAALSRRLIEDGLPPSWPADRVLCHIRRTDSVVLTARFQGQWVRSIAGFAIMQFAEDHAHLNLLAVDTVHQRRGLGRQLMLWLHDSALVAGTFVLGLELRARNASARRFYESLGYQPGAVMRGYYQGLEDAQRMHCDLRVGSGATTA
jgi:ribosomal protein S18 acetylase RimI-like enzyme